MILDILDLRDPPEGGNHSPRRLQGSCVHMWVRLVVPCVYVVFRREKEYITPIRHRYFCWGIYKRFTCRIPRVLKLWKYPK
jgi:hypothetical protein